MKERNLLKNKRNKIVKEIIQIRNILSKLSYKLDNVSNSDLSHLQDKFDRLTNDLQELNAQYVSNLPKSALSRSPFSKEIYHLTIDTFGLDRPWWDAENPVRNTENEPYNFFALTGSISINKNIPKVPFLVKPGPAVPWVSPRLLDNDDIIAVLSHIKIGEYDAYPVVYYAKEKNDKIERINTWGTDYYLAEDSEGFALPGSTFDDEEEYDFDIAKWIRKGKLKWIAKDDSSLTLQDDFANCPYIDLSGYRYPVLIRNQKLISTMITFEYAEDEIENTEKNLDNTPHFCSKCGTPLKQGTKFCGNCGNKIG